MLPPIEDSLLQSNPKFAALHAILTKNILDSSGSTKIQPAQKERDVVAESLKAARIRAIKSHLICTALATLDPSSYTTTSTKSKSQPKTTQQTSLPPELLELILLISSKLSAPAISQSSAALLESSERWTSIPANLPQIGAMMSTHLQTQALALAKVVFPTSNASFLHRQIPKLLPSVVDLQREISDKKTNVSRHRIGLVSKATTLISLYHVAIVLIIRILEQNKHGSIARNAKTRSEFLCLSAQKEELEGQILARKAEKMMYTDEVKSALENYLHNLKDGTERLKERRRDLERELWGYGVGREEGQGHEGKERTMKEIARVYGKLLRDVTEVRKDVKRLTGR